MRDPPTIHNISAAYVVRLLMPQSYGTYIVRRQTVNDEIISLISINNELAPSYQKDAYAVLSVRVDETIYKCPLMNYRLSLFGSNGEENDANILEQYDPGRSHLDNYTPLTHELMLMTEQEIWTMVPNELYHINFNRTRFGGKNNSGVSDAIWRRPNKPEIKVFIKSFSKNSNYYENELNLLKQLCYFSITSLLGHYSDSQNNYLVFAHAGRSLESICPLQARTITSKIKRIVNISFQISNAMIYLEKYNIVHRDLTASNVLIDSHGFVRIADFGHAIQREAGKNNLSRSITNSGEYRFQIRFLAPECMPRRYPTRNNQCIEDFRRGIYASFTSKSDVWAFGIVIIQLLLENPSKPYPHIDNDRDVPERIVVKREIHPRPDDCPIDIYYILQQCWAYQPINRISFVEIREKMKMLLSIIS